MAHSIILADTQVSFRAGAARVLAGEPDIHLAAQCSSLALLSEAVANYGGSIVVFPSSIAEDLHGLLDSIEQAGSKSVVIVEHGATLEGSLAERASGIVPRSVTGAQMLECLRRVGAGERCVQQVNVPEVPSPDDVGARVLERLTPKELQILALVSEGGKNKDIAALLGTKEQVVKNYLLSIYDKTGVSDRLELTLFTLHHRTLAEAAERVRQGIRRGSGGA